MSWSAILWITAAVLLALYSILIVAYRKWFLVLKPYTLPAGVVPGTRFSIIIPARDEEEFIGKCVQYILDQEYPSELFEVIVIDDHSTDATSSIIRGLQQRYNNLQLVELAKEMKGQQLNSYKKKAIETAIGKCDGDWIITTDADCSIGSQWLLHFEAYIQQHRPVFIAAPVRFINTGSFVSIFQCLDFMSMQGITAAAVSAGFHSMCNGANLAYSRKAFLDVGGFSGIDNIASGDDMLLMHKIKKAFPGGTGYLFSQESIVATAPMPDWKSFINQRIRWASKADKYQDKGITMVLALVYLMNLAMVLLLIAGFFHPRLWLMWLLLTAVKTLVEYTFMFPVASFFRQRALMGWFAIMQPVHMLYIVIAGWLGKFGKYQWKGRTVK